uniref:Uncharacterized protein n=1 Tax=Glossina brevipalpis TaxID=37001 RepID=A0A1A9VZR2_9MUSC
MNALTQQVNTALSRTIDGGLRHDVVADVRTKQVLREAVDAVVQSFSNHTRGYGRGSEEIAFSKTEEEEEQERKVEIS